MLTSDEFIKRCKALVIHYENSQYLDPTDNVSISEDNVYVVWSCFILGNQKALLSTTLTDGMYFEITYNNDKDCIYFDAYKKWDNKEIKL